MPSPRWSDLLTTATFLVAAMAGVTQCEVSYSDINMATAFTCK